MRAVSYDIVRYLESEAGLTVGGTSDWALYSNGYPDSPDNCIMVYDVGGAPAATYMGAPLKYIDYPLFQIRVRGISQISANEQLDALIDGYLASPCTWWIKQENDAIYTDQSSVRSTPGVYTQYMNLLPQGGRLNLGRDENERWMFSAVFSSIRTDATT